MNALEKLSKLIGMQNSFYDKNGYHSYSIRIQIDSVISSHFYLHWQHEANIDFQNSTADELKFWVEWKTIDHLDNTDYYYHYNVSVDPINCNVKVTGSNPDHKHDIEMYFKTVLMQNTRDFELTFAA